MNRSQVKSFPLKSRLSVLFLMILGLAGGLWLGATVLGPAPGPGSPALARATLLPQPKLLGPFGLKDHLGEKFSLSSLQDRWTFLVFGYANCPDVCPTTLALLSQAQDLLVGEPESDKNQFVFVSVDPERDSLEELGVYVKYFNPEFIAATGDKDDIDRLSGQLGVMYAKVTETESAMGYLVDHTASIISKFRFSKAR